MAALSRLASGPHLGVRLGPAFFRTLLGARAHAGFEAAASLGQVWRSALLRRPIQVVFERIPRASIPRAPGDRVEWLRELWREVDAWLADRSG